MQSGSCRVQITKEVHFMKNATKWLSLLLAVMMALAAVPALAEEVAAEEEAVPTIVQATATFGQKFSPFFATTTYDQDLVNLVTGSLLAADRGGAVIYNGIEGETINYNGTDYTYYGMGNVEVVMNDDGTVDYNLTMRDDIVFSDGTPATIDDVIFGIYVLSDPTYDGSSTLYALPIEGMEEYRNAMSSLATLLIAAGPDNTDFTLWSEDIQTAFWSDINEAGAKMAQEIIDYCVASYLDYAPDYIGASAEDVLADSALQTKLGMFLWGFDGDWFEGATAEDYWKAIYTAYEGDIVTASDTENAGTSLFDFIDNYSGKYSTAVATGESVPNIKGIIRTGDYSLTVHMTEFSATAIYDVSFLVAPLHYYGDTALYDYENNSFGFVKGDLSTVRAKTTQPLGCGPYKFVSYENGVATLEANELYFQGKPVTDRLLIQESTDSDYVPGIVTGTFDVTSPAISEDTIKSIQDANSNGELTGDVLTTYLVDYRGYGYIGVSADLVNVNGEPASEASKNLRKAFMTLFAVHRDTVIHSYYGDRASVIEYPISNTSWAAPRPTDEGYQLAYSKDVDGNPIYTEGMSDEQKYVAAENAAIGYLKAAGYEFDEAAGIFTAAPENTSMSFEIMIPGDGIQDHPAYGIAVAASEALAKVGITLQVNDVGTSTWNNALEGNTAQMWAAAWQASVDPDMTQVYHSSNAHGQGTNSNHYAIDDEELDALIYDGRRSADTEFRKATYKQAMEIILDWGVELPTYQRKECYVTSTIRLDNDTMPKDLTPYWVWYAEIETLAVK